LQLFTYLYPLDLVACIVPVMITGMTARAVQTVVSVLVVGAVVFLQVHEEKRVQSVAAVAHSQPGIPRVSLIIQPVAAH
jgi:hypothetical protein